MLVRVSAVPPLLAVVALPALVAARLGRDGAGVFSAAWSVAVVLAAATTAVVWWTLRVRRDRCDVRADRRNGHRTRSRVDGVEPGDDATRTALERSLVLAVPAVVVVLVGSPWILAAFGSHARDTGVGSLVLLALATVPYAVVTVATRAAAVAGRTGVAIGPPVVALAVALAGGWVLMPAAGVLGAAFGWLAGQTLVAASVLVGPQARRLRVRESCP